MKCELCGDDADDTFCPRCAVDPASFARVAVDGSAADGLAADGLAADGLAADGLAADGLAADGMWLVRRAAVARGQAPTYSWDRHCRAGYSYQGYGLDELLRRLLLQEAARRCRQCGAGDCTHEAARIVISEIVAQEP